MWKQIESFFWREDSPLPLGVFRIGLALLLLAQVVMCSGQFFELWGTQGLLQEGLGERFARDGMFQTTEVIRWAAPYGLSERTVLVSLAGLYLVSLISFLFGFLTRWSALLCWGLHFLLAQGHFTGYGVDLYSHFALFYACLMPMGASLSLDRLLSRRSLWGEPSWQSGLSVRVWQCHLAIAYFATGIEKARGAQWLDGDAVWRALMLPLFRRFDLGWLSHVPWLVVLLGWGTLLIEVGYPLFIFYPKTRNLWIGLVLSLHAGIGIFMGLHLFALLMMLLTFCFFGLTQPSYVEVLRRFGIGMRMTLKSPKWAVNRAA